MNKPLNSIPLIVIITIITGAIMYWTHTDTEEKINKHHEELSHLTTSNYEGVVNGLITTSKLLFEEIVNNPEVINIMKRAHTSFGSEKKELRHELYVITNKIYNRIKKHGFRQLHFHLKTCESFLRLHNPEHFGDNLRVTRYSVAKVNKDLKPIYGFEEGKNFNGYRFVYPIMQDTTHYGSVETSVSFKFIADQLTALKDVKTGMLFQKQPIEAKIFQEQLKKYEDCVLDNTILFDKALIKDEKHKHSYALFKTLYENNPDKIRNAIKSKYTNVLDISHKNVHYSLVLVPISNIQGNLLGNMFVAYKDAYSEQIIQSKRIRFSIIIVMYIFCVLGIFMINKHERKVLKTNAELKKLQLKNEEANEVKNRLFEIITHDLRNHFNAVNGFADLLTKQGMQKPEKFERLSNGLHDAIHLTTNLMNNLFVWSRIQIGKVEFKPELFEVSKWFNEELQRYKSITERKNVNVDNKTKGPVYIRADVDMLVYIIRNTVHNAIKYSVKGETITTKITDNTKETVIQIEDRGKGMSDTEINKVLSKENWTGSHLNKDIGLGLFITRQLIEYHNGVLEIKSDLGIGTTISIRFPKHT
ncbi:MAG: ATP-binding protein [Salinivirgaceae bacterium]|jgi:signal transduction histidine kinase|nr:ATP-binding protein [Salinivirgaceae bacterium]